MTHVLTSRTSFQFLILIEVGTNAGFQV